MKVCNHCGGQNEDSTRFCTSCGARFPEQQTQTYQQPAPAPTPAPSSQSYDDSFFSQAELDAEPTTYSGLAIAGFVLSIISIFCCGFTAVLSLIFSIAGLIVSAKKTKKGAGLAIAGLIISAILTLFMVACLAVSWAAIETAYKEASNGDIDEFFEILESELEQMEEEQGSGRSSRRSSSSDDDEDIDDEDLYASNEWTDLEVSSDFSEVTITYTDGIPDDFEFYDADFDDICDALEDNLVVTDNFGVNHSFDREAYRRLVTMVLISPDEYDRLSLSRDEVVQTMAYLATVSFEMNEDGFTPERAIYTESDNTYDFYGIIEPNNIGRAVIIFTDGTNSYNFEDAMCGDEICWQIDPSDPDTYRLGLSSDTLNEYPGGGVEEFTDWVISIIDPVI